MILAARADRSRLCSITTGFLFFMANFNSIVMKFGGTSVGRAWGLSIYAAVIVKYRDEKTERSVELEDYLR